MAGLPWVEIDTNLPRHSKSLLLGVKLGDRRAWTHQLELLLWVAENLPTGRFEGQTAAVLVEQASGWTGEVGRFVEAAIAVGFLDKDGDAILLHGWAERAAAHVAKAAHDRQRQRLRRERISERFAPHAMQKAPDPETAPALGVRCEKAKRSQSDAVWGDRGAGTRPRSLPDAPSESMLWR